MYHLRTPKDELEFATYYHFRWEMLRKPFNQPLGSEKDGYDATAHHQMVVDDKTVFLRSAAYILMQITKVRSVF